MIPKSALEALNKLVEKWRTTAKFMEPPCGPAFNECADLLERELQSIEPTEARAGEDGLSLLMQRNEWRSALLGLCDKETYTPLEAAAYVRVRIGKRASPLPKAETQPVAWRAWSKPVPGRKWPSDQWVYWDEEPTTIQDDPEFSQFQALYAHPAPEAATIDAEAAALKAAKEIFNLHNDAVGEYEYDPPTDAALAEIILKHFPHSPAPGMVLVPEELTEAMRQAGYSAAVSAGEMRYSKIDFIWEKVIAAAPIAPEGVPGVEK